MADVEVCVPKLGMAMTEATLVAWYVADGDKVEQGQPLYSLETDKVEMDVEAPTTGIVRHLGEPGDTYAVGVAIATITARLGT